jgi:hypothetical protein
MVAGSPQDGEPDDGGDAPQVLTIEGDVMHTETMTAATQPTVYVVATTFTGTRPALEAAIPLAKGSRARLVVLVPQVVPYPLPVDVPTEATAFTEGRYRDLVHEMNGEAEIKVCLCRTPRDVVQTIPPASTVVLGGPTGAVLPSREERLTRRLTHIGHRVIFAPISVRSIEHGLTPPNSNTGVPGSFVSGWTPHVRKAENRVTAALPVKF